MDQIINPLYISIVYDIIGLLVIVLIVYKHLKYKQRRRCVNNPAEDLIKREPSVITKEAISAAKTPTPPDKYSEPISTLPHLNVNSNTQEIKVKRIVSIANVQQLIPIKIGYEPSADFEQQKLYQYAVAKMPLKNSLIKIPRKGYAYNKGMTEDKFYELCKKYFGKSFDVHNDRFVPNGSNRPYEPDLVVYSEKECKNIYIDIEIDEPYDIGDRKPIHCIGQDDVRDDFFTKRGWIVIRFTERQVSQEPFKCCSFVAKVIRSVDKTFYSELLSESSPSIMPQWDTLQAEKWAKEKYREKYLDIDVSNINNKEVCEYEIYETSADVKVEEYVSKLNKVRPAGSVNTSAPSKTNDKSVYTPPNSTKYPSSNNKSRYKKYYKPDSLFDFGKYKGKKLIDVYKKDQSYIYWCKNNVEYFHISSEDLNYMDTLFTKVENTSIRKNTNSGCMVVVMFILIFNILFTAWIIV